jgi:hypothetical protein
MKKQYSVLTHDANFTPPDLGSLLPIGEFDVAEEAIACLKREIDKQLLKSLNEGKTAKEAYDQFSLYGEVPIIRGEPSIYIQPYEYAKQRVMNLASNIEIAKMYVKHFDSKQKDD